ncbi:hypothetical protein VZ94_13880 [Methylocucumis oryzae]|uniref:histidine kinase n=2 Tax=Methylocucumis oryzae TaxID=1632867 RepID=A0A0F3IHP9_9GAMM|nr:hypothetical protein VZ94_13880 [Methylocucumis oryzae]
MLIMRSHVLLIDSDSTMHLSVCQYLTDAGFELVSTVSSLEDGIDVIKFNAPALVLLALTRPIIDDSTRLAGISALLVDEQIPLIMIVDTEEAERIQQCYELGATDVVIKPINWQILVHRLHYILKTHQALNRLAISELRLSNAQRLAKLGNWEWTIKDGHLYWSHEIYDIYQYHEHDASGNRPFLFAAVDELDLPKVEEAFNRALKFKETVNIDYRIKRKDGVLVWLNQQIQPVIDKQGRLTGLTGTIQNITERKKNEKRLTVSGEDY